MKDITISLTDERYAALAKTQALMKLAGGQAETPEAYVQFVMDNACDSYAQTYAEVSIDVYKRRAEEAEVLARQEAEKAAVGESLADRIGAL